MSLAFWATVLIMVGSLLDCLMTARSSEVYLNGSFHDWWRVLLMAVRIMKIQNNKLLQFRFYSHIFSQFLTCIGSSYWRKEDRITIVHKSLCCPGEKDYETKVAKPISGKFQGHLPYSSFHTRPRSLFFQTQLYECLKSHLYNTWLTSISLYDTYLFTLCIKSKELRRFPRGGGQVRQVHDKSWYIFIAQQ